MCLVISLVALPLHLYDEGSGTYVTRLLHLKPHFYEHHLKSNKYNHQCIIGMYYTCTAVFCKKGPCTAVFCKKGPCSHALKFVWSYDFHQKIMYYSVTGDYTEHVVMHLVSCG